jgi:hypothetical protein
MNATEWTTKSVNDLPDSSFAYIEPGGSKDAVGKTIPRSLRHLPYKSATGDVEPFLLTQAIESVSKAALPEATKKRIAKKLAEVSEVAGIMPDKPPTTPGFCECGDEHCSGTMRRKAALIEKYITNDDGEFQVRSEDGKVLGTHASKDEAVAQLRAIEANKHKKDADTVSPLIVDQDKLIKDYEAFCATIKSSDPGSRVQALMFDRAQFPSAKDARGWANDHGFQSSPAKAMMGGNFHIAQSAEAFDELRPINLTEGVSAIIGMPVKSIEAVQRAFAGHVRSPMICRKLA